MNKHDWSVAAAVVGAAATIVVYQICTHIFCFFHFDPSLTILSELFIVNNQAHGKEII